MRRFLAIFFAFVLVFSMIVTVSATDMTDSEKEFFDHEETGVELPYRLSLPEVYDDKFQFPLVVFFHGAGERGMENEKQLANGVQDIRDNMQKAIILAPQCSHFGQWVDTPWEQGGYSVDEVPESDEMMAVMALVQQITETYSVDKDRIYAMGISMGGFGVWDVMVRHNDVFAAGVAVCGAGDPTKADVLKDTPMFVFHGSQDDTVPVSGSSDMVDAIQKAGGTKIQYTEYPGAGHGIWGQVFKLETLYKDINRCKLTDRYPDIFEDKGNAPAPVNEIVYYILGGIGAVVVILVIVLIVGSRKKPKKLEE